MYKKSIIVFEGVEGSGKSFHINNVARYLKKNKIKFIKIREPGGSENSEKIRRMILSNKSNFNKTTDLFLYLASRNENIVNLINKNYGKKIILIDRFVDSTVAYQHYGMGIDINFIQTVNRFILKNLRIKFTFLNLVNSKNLRLRLSKRSSLNRYDKFKMQFYNRVQRGYIKIANNNKKKYLKINSNLDISINKKIIINQIHKLI